MILHTYPPSDFVVSIIIKRGSNIRWRFARMPLTIYKTYKEDRSGDDAISGSADPAQKFVVNRSRSRPTKYLLPYLVGRCCNVYDEQPIENKKVTQRANLFLLAFWLQIRSSWMNQLFSCLTLTRKTKLIKVLRAHLSLVLWLTGTLNTKKSSFCTSRVAYL